MSGYKTENGTDLDDIFQKLDNYENKNISSEYKVNSNTLNGRYISRSDASSVDSVKHVGYLDSNNNDLNISFLRLDDVDSWTQKQKIIADDEAQPDYFGRSVAIHNNYAIVGAFDKTNVTAAYIFERQSDGWTQKAKLIADDKAQSDYFGISVAIHNNYAIVGASSTSSTSSTGKAYIFSNLLK